jgi:hypothetical protein
MERRTLDSSIWIKSSVTAGRRLIWRAKKSGSNPIASGYPYFRAATSRASKPRLVSRLPMRRQARANGGNIAQAFLVIERHMGEATKREITCDRIDFISLYWSASFSRGNRILFSHKIYWVKVLGPPPNRLRANRSALARAILAAALELCPRRHRAKRGVLAPATYEGASDLCLNRLRANRSNGTFSDSGWSSRGRIEGADHYLNSKRPMQR